MPRFRGLSIRRRGISKARSTFIVQKRKTSQQSSSLRSDNNTSSASIESDSGDINKKEENKELLTLNAKDEEPFYRTQPRKVPKSFSPKGLSDCSRYLHPKERIKRKHKLQHSE